MKHWPVIENAIITLPQKIRFKPVELDRWLETTVSNLDTIVWKHGLKNKVLYVIQFRFSFFANAANHDNERPIMAALDHLCKSAIQIHHSEKVTISGVTNKADFEHIKSWLDCIGLFHAPSLSVS